MFKKVYFSKEIGSLITKKVKIDFENENIYFWSLLIISKNEPKSFKDIESSFRLHCLFVITSLLHYLY